MIATETVPVDASSTADWASIEAVWHDLAESSPHTTFFVSPIWVRAWLDVFAEQLRPEFLVFRAGSKAVGACLLVLRKHQYGFFPVRRAFFNTAGELEGGPHVEFNTILCLPGWEQAVAASFQSWVAGKEWDELSLNGFCPGPPLEAIRSAFSDFDLQSTIQTNYWVDLDDIRTNRGADYESALGSKTRKHLRQAYRAYGDITTECAGDLNTALALLDELAVLHQKHWNAQGLPGAFASPYFMRFHRRLVELAFPAGGIQLLRFRTPDAIIGVLYNFVYRGKVYFYQSGFAYAADKKLRPGIVSIGQAVQHCLQDVRLSEFHMMADGGHYKEHMSSHSHPVEWLLVRKRNIRNRTVDALRTVKWKIAPPKGRATPVASEGTNDSGA